VSTTTELTWDDFFTSAHHDEQPETVPAVTATEHVAAHKN